MSPSISTVPPARMSYWLVPAEPALSHYKAVISDLAKRFDGPCFVPHVTIYTGPFDQGDRVRDILGELSRRKDVELRPTSLLFSDRFTQSCFIQFESSEVIAEMCEGVRSGVQRPGPYRVVPHMSLFYGSLTESQRDIIRTELSLPPAMSFNLISAIANPSQVVSRKDVEYWTEVDRVCLCELD